MKLTFCIASLFTILVEPLMARNPGQFTGCAGSSTRRWLCSIAVQGYSRT
jgi:hypothetical protein